ncbi:MAG TPA: inositol monophosphatase, partial [Candidatus Sulfotelmatobacter sp.]|nr:inositol monophosphatase [Candidatus Sulfotelmatobacter sp.]
PDAATHRAMKQTLLHSVEEAGKILRGYFGKLLNPRIKESSSSVVCDADLAAEKEILKTIRSRFPEHSVIAEESGYLQGPSEYTWVIDPLDGTSNFVAGLPWFGVQIGLLRGGVPILAAMYLPLEDTLYFAEAGRGASKNGRAIRVTAEPRLQHVLCAFGHDANGNPRRKRQNAELLFRVASGVRNIRTTNSLVDFCYTADGRLGGCLNLNTKIWDIVPVCLILPEAGGKLTDLQGKEIVFGLDEKTFGRSYEVLGASRTLHPKLVALAKAQ